MSEVADLIGYVGNLPRADAMRDLDRRIATLKGWTDICKTPSGTLVGCLPGQPEELSPLPKWSTDDSDAMNLFKEMAGYGFKHVQLYHDGNDYVCLYDPADWVDVEGVGATPAEAIARCYIAWKETSDA